MSHVPCPRCQQGTVIRRVIRETGEPVAVCDECEATWLNAPIADSGFGQLTVLLEERGLRPLWDELTPYERE